MSPRSSLPLQFYSFPSPDGREQIAVIDSGVVIRVDDGDPEGPVDIATDRLVFWTLPDAGQLNFGSFQQQSDAPLEFYLEGNIVFRQGQRVVYARSMYYDVRARNGIVLDSEVLSPVEQYQGLLRVKADVLRMVDPQRMVAYGAAVTSSRLGVPRFWFQTQSAELEDLQQPFLGHFLGPTLAGPADDLMLGDRRILVSSRNNFIYLAGTPVFYWPVLQTDLTKPSFYLERFAIKNDKVFGTQVLTDWDMYQLLGILDPPSGTEWTGALDYLSERGWAGGTNFRYDRGQFLHFTGPVAGELDVWGIHDSGLDNLGEGRRELIPEDQSRGRLFWRHRQRLASGLQVTAEAGLISDRNFLEQYFEQEWDELKDQTTGVELKQILGNSSWNLLASARPNEFLTQTQWLPRADHFQFGQSLLEDHVTWMAHSHVGYANLKTAVPSAVVDDPTLPLAWETDSTGAQYFTRQGLRSATRQEIDVPLNLGPVKLVAYALGEAAYWGEDQDAQDESRLLGQIGLRASIPFWRVDPTLENELFDLHGLAHKVAFDADVFVADATQDIEQFPLYDPLDDDAQEAFRRKFFVPGGPLYGQPADLVVRYDEVAYAVRAGLQRWVSGPTEIADDLAAFRLGVRQRWQTKRGMPGYEHVVDWVTLDLGGTWYPRPDRDNFGSDVGMINYDLRWHVGDRVTLLSDGYADTFSDGLRTVSIGGFLTRPGKTQAYVGLRSIEGPVSSNVISSAFSYRLSPKWITTSGTFYDLSATGNIGQSYEITRVGESFLTSFSFRYDLGRDNVSVGFAVEPRFLATSHRGQIGGVSLAPAGAFGIE